MKRGHIYTLVFMVVLSAALTFALAAAYEGFKPAIQSNTLLKERRAVLSALGLDTGLKDGEVAAVYAEKIREDTKLNGRTVKARVENGAPLAYAVPFEGAALWGALRGYLGVNAGLNATTGLVFTYQNETPGLGGRIEEEAYLKQFRGLPIGPQTQLKYGEGDGYRIDAVTGATQTSSAVLRVLNQALRDSVFNREVN